MDDVLSWLMQAKGVSELSRGDQIQQLWAGYGQIERVLRDGMPWAVVKDIRPPAASALATSFGHRRKLRSYQVERAFYRWHAATPIRVGYTVPALLADADHPSGSWLALQDLGAAGFQTARRPLSSAGIEQGLRWLACFHATHLGRPATDLWPHGSYWHLETRPDELAQLTTSPRARHRELVAYAERWARALRAVPQTWVHGDAKVANFLFGPSEAAAVDFQYVGGGCGMVDVAYFLGSAVADDRLHWDTERWLDCYFAALEQAGCGQLQDSWRPLYPVAWADFMRFMEGWAPGRGRGERYGWLMVEQAKDLV